jgi:hypothetical protein
MHVDMCSRFLTNLSEEMQSAVRCFVGSHSNDEFR